jgi:hypothetical protein
MARLVACRDAMAAGRGSGRVVGVRALWTIVRHTDDSLEYCSLCPAACVCMLAPSGERDTFGVGCGKGAHKACLMPHAWRLRDDTAEALYIKQERWDVGDVRV